MFNDVPPEIEEALNQYALIMEIILISLFALWMLYEFIAKCITEKMRREYIKKIDNDHDKAVILEYKNTRFSLFNRKKKSK